MNYKVSSRYTIPSGATNRRAIWNKVIPSGIPTDYIARYLLDGDANDVTTNYNGTATDVTWTTETLGSNSKVATFNGSTSNIYNDTFLDAGLSAWSCSFWFKTTMSGTRGFMIAKTDTTGPYPFELNITTDNKLELYFNTRASGINSFKSTNTVNDGNWHHCVLYGNSSGRSSVGMYIDNASTGALNNITGSDSGAIATSTNRNYTMGRRGDGSEGFTGSLALVTWYNRIITTDQIAALYNEV